MVSASSSGTPSKFGHSLSRVIVKPFSERCARWSERGRAIRHRMQGSGQARPFGLGSSPAMQLFSRRTAHDSQLNSLTCALRERRARGLPVCDLTESNPTRTGLPYDEARLLGALADPRALR